MHRYFTYRHGNETLVDGNVFIGNNKPSTGGVRVINGQQTVVNNYGVGLTATILEVFLL